MVNCPFCKTKVQVNPMKTWRFRFYNVERLQCPKCQGIFNYYHGTSNKGKKSEFTIRVKPRTE